MDEIKDKIQDLVSGRLSVSEEKEVRAVMEQNETLSNYYQLLLLSESAIEEDIASEHRTFLKSLSNNAEKTQPRNNNIIYWIGIAASILILVISIITANLSLTDGDLADQYTYNTISIRSADSEEDIIFNQAQKAYRDGEYELLWEKLNNIQAEGSLLEKDKEWLTAITYLKTEGSNSESFRKSISEITEDTQHPYHEDAVKLISELQSVWRVFVVKK